MMRMVDLSFLAVRAKPELQPEDEVWVRKSNAASVLWLLDVVGGCVNTLSRSLAAPMAGAGTSLDLRTRDCLSSAL